MFRPFYLEISGKWVYLNSSGQIHTSLEEGEGERSKEKKNHAINWTTARAEQSRADGTGGSGDAGADGARVVQFIHLCK